METGNVKDKTENPNLDEVIALMEKYNCCHYASKRMEIFSEWMDFINDEYGNKPPKVLHLKCLEVLKPELSDDNLGRLGLYYDRIGDSENAVHYYLLGIKKTSNYRILANLAQHYSKKNKYKESIKCFDECDCDKIANHLERKTIMYNHGFVLQLSGDYKTANKILDKLTRLYLDKSVEKDDPQQWLDCGDHFLLNLNNPLKAIEQYEEGIKCEIDDPKLEIELLIGLVNAYNGAPSYLSPGSKNKATAYKIKAQIHFDTAYRLINENNLQKKFAGELNFANRDFSEAKQYYQTLIKEKKFSLGQEQGDVYFFLGLCFMHTNEFADAIKNFETSIHHPHAPFVNIHIAQCHKKMGNFSEAETCLDEVLGTAQFNTNALLAQVFLYIDWADHLKLSNADRSIILLSEGISIASELLKDYNNNSKNYLRKLSEKEISELKYSISYSFVEKSKLLKTKKAKIEALSDARRFLSDLNRNGDDYFRYKSERTLNEINSIIDDYTRTNLAPQKTLIAFGITILVIGLFLILVGKPVIKSGYFLDTDILSQQMHISKEKLDSTFANKNFDTRPEMEQYVNLYFGGKIMESKTTIIPKSSYYQFSAIKVESTIVIFVLSTGVIFILLGVISNQLKTLKVGVIEIEKISQVSQLDQANLKMSR